MVVVQEGLRTGWADYRAGRLGDAEAAARQSLSADPASAAALDLLASVYQAQGRLAEAVALYGEALARQPSFADAHVHLGVALAQQGRFTDAAASFRRALACQPELTDAHFHLGEVLRRQGDCAGAAAAYAQALRRQPELAEAHRGRGLALARLGRPAEAEPHFRQLVRLQPQRAASHHNLGTVLLDLNRPAEAVAPFVQAIALEPAMADAHNNLGRAWRLQERYAEAIASYREALRLKPDSADVHINLGEALGHEGDVAGAIEHFHQAVRLAPAQAAPRRNLGMALVRQGALAEAIPHLEEALRLAPPSPDVLSDLGFALWKTGRLPEAMAALDRAVALDPQHVQAHLNRALLRLSTGDFARGWDEYEWRFRTGDIPPAPPLGRPAWDGRPIAGQAILLHTEQGAGDSIQFARYGALLQRRGATVYLACPAALVPLLSSCAGIDRVVAKGTPLPPFDLHTPLLSLPRLMDTTAQSIPADVPYLSVEPALVEEWRLKLARVPELRVGIAWKGSPKHKEDHRRSIPLTAFAPLAALAGVHLVSLQYGPGTEQLAAAGAPAVFDPGPLRRPSADPFLETAAIVRNLDLVVTIDSAVAHLAGALGVPVWVLLPRSPDWRWQFDREDSPWYPTMRLFRQDASGQWPALFERVAAALRTQIERPAPARPVRVEVAPGELLDKIAILRIKAERIADASKRRNVQTELEALEAARAAALLASAELDRLAAELQAVNEALWDVEDALRICEKAGDFGPRFVELARSVYRHNDRRAALKRQINERLGSRLIEEKSYADYGGGAASR